ncbi:S9 family peptidase [Paraflavisolibacter sp. H34]|uniref:S9 family peptidase n=1 Tax=Huijunlia imazamoxiresistens TaxID=3127457 RepID=UPI00301AB999
MKQITQLFLIAFFSFFLQPLSAQSLRGVKWAADGSGYFALEGNAIVRYQLPSFQRSVVVDSLGLVPPGGGRALSVRNFYFTADGSRALLYTHTQKVWRQDTRGDYWLWDKPARSLRQLGKGRPASSLMFAKFSPDGSKVAYVSEHNLYVEEVASGAVRQLTTDGSSRVINGTFDWAYEEEFDCRDGFRWSPDSRQIAYWQVDARSIRNFLMINNTDSLYSFTVPVEYPKAGEDPSAARVGVVSLETGSTRWMQVPGDARQHYIPRMEWAVDGRELVLEQLNRKQNEAKIFRCQPATGEATLIYSEKDAAWIDVKARWSDDPTGWDWLKGGEEFLWVSEKDGWRHLYRLDKKGKEVLLTRGNYDVIELKAVDEKGGYIYFTASPKQATQQYLYRVRLDGKKELELVSPAAQQGTHDYSLSPSATYATHNFSNLRGQRVSEWIRVADHKTIKPLAAQLQPQQDRDIRLFQVTTEEGVTMDGWMILPDNFDSSKKYPVLFYVYAEPAGATVKDADGSAGTRLYRGNMAADGYIQISLDGRGTPAPKGAAWRKAIYRNIGTVNIRDQAGAAQKILQWPFVDTGRIAVWGWSGGGSTTLNLLFQYPQIYKTGIAIAPVANQLLYDNIYQERYMGLPQENREDFLKGSPITHAKNLQGNLLVIHGTGDDNVHYQGTEQLINELIKQGRYFQMMSYPNRTHSINEGPGTSQHLSQLFTRYLQEHCPGGGR